MKIVVRSLVLVGLLAALPACGYRPLYATDSNGGSVATDLSNIAVQETGTRIGQQLRNKLLSTMRPAGQEGQDLYRLVLTPAVTDLVQADQGLGGVKRHRLRLNVSFALYENKSGKVVKSGKVASSIGYDTVYQPVADMQAKDNAIERAVVEASSDIRNRLAAFMSSRSS